MSAPLRLAGFAAALAISFAGAAAAGSAIDADGGTDQRTTEPASHEGGHGAAR